MRESTDRHSLVLDSTTGAAFKLLRTRRRLGAHLFPRREDYVGMVGSLIDAGAEACDVYEFAQRDWFRRGQTGCVFARIAAHEPETRWPYYVHDLQRFDRTAADAVGLAITKYEATAEAEVLSILLPNCRSIDGLRDNVMTLVDAGVLFEEGRVVHDLGTTYQIRRALSSDVAAWVMAFGPCDDFPLTRQAPFYELALRVKGKNDDIYYRLNQERSIAHLADYPLEMSLAHWDHRWVSTERRTREILGAEPDVVSAAKSTFTIRQETGGG